MTATAAEKPPTWYKVGAVVLLLWMVMGIAAFVMDLMSTPEQIAALSAEQQELLSRRPQWLFIVYGVATGSGLLGAIALLLRKALAVPLLTASLATVVVQMGYTLFGLDAIGILGVALAVPFPLTIFAIGAFAVWFAMNAKRRGWLS